MRAKLIALLKQENMNRKVFNLKIGESLKINDLQEDGRLLEIIVTRSAEGWTYNPPLKGLHYVPEIPLAKANGKYSIS